MINKTISDKFNYDDMVNFSKTTKSDNFFFFFYDRHCFYYDKKDKSLILEENNGKNGNLYNSNQIIINNNNDKLKIGITIFRKFKIEYQNIKGMKEINKEDLSKLKYDVKSFINEYFNDLKLSNIDD